MRRQKLDNGSWFDRDTSTKFKEDRDWNGNNMISCATNSQWDHEALYRTAGGRYVLHEWSQWQGSLDSWSEISKESAAKWLIVNGHDEDDCEELAPEIAELEVR